MDAVTPATEPELPRPPMRESITAVILCGGQARRLGGIDKPLRTLAGESLLARILHRLNDQTSAQILNINQAHSGYLAYERRWVDDGPFAGIGPIAGIYAGLSRCTTPWLLCVPGDIAQLPADLCARLCAALQASPSARAAVVHDGRGLQPLVCLLNTALLDDLGRAIAAGEQSPARWLRSIAALEVDFADQPAWIWSLNTEVEWQAAEILINAC